MKRITVLWSDSDIEMLRRSIQDHSTANWVKISKCVTGRDNQSWHKKWFTQILAKNVSLNWTSSEDDVISQWKQEDSDYDFSKLQQLLPERNVEDVRDRWLSLTKTSVRLNWKKWSQKDKNLFAKLYPQWGSDASKYVSYFPTKSKEQIEKHLQEKAADESDEVEIIKISTPAKAVNSKGDGKENSKKNDNPKSKDKQGYFYGDQGRKIALVLSTITNFNDSPKNLKAALQAKTKRRKEESKVQEIQLSINRKINGKLSGTKISQETQKENKRALKEKSKQHDEITIEKSSERTLNCQRKTETKAESEWAFYMNKRF